MSFRVLEYLRIQVVFVANIALMADCIIWLVMCYYKCLLVKQFYLSLNMFLENSSNNCISN
jgi:hypothetical protein